MKKNKTTFVMLLFFFMGLLVLLYPSLSNLYNLKFQSEAIVDYEAILKEFDAQKYDDEFKKAEEYNTNLSKLKRPFYEYKKIAGYDEVLNVGDNGMMGYLSISKIGVELPIYHGTTDEVLNKAVGHLEGTSLPIGGIGTHSALSAHRGLPSSKLFTDLDKLEKGDIFTITILDRLLTYQIDQIIIVEPREIEQLEIDSNLDYVTLVTCTTYGINTHRMLVRGVRIENAVKPKYITTEAFKISNLIVTPMVALPIIFISLLAIALKPIKKNKNWKDKYIYPNKVKQKAGGNAYEKYKS